MITNEGDGRNTEDSMLSSDSRLLTAIAAAASLNCRPCLETLIPKALEQGILPEEIREIFSVVSAVRERAALPPGVLATLLGQDEPTGAKACCDSGGKCM